MEHVNSLPSTMPSPQISDVPNGTGTTKPVSNAQRTGSSMLTVFALLSVITVPLMMPLELVLDASKDMT